MSGKCVQADPMLPHNSRYCKCGACGEYFTAVGTFDLHREGPAEDRRCIYPGDVRRKKSGVPVLAKNEKGYWFRIG